MISWQYVIILLSSWLILNGTVQSQEAQNMKQYLLIVAAQHKEPSSKVNSSRSRQDFTLLLPLKESYPFKQWRKTKNSIGEIWLIRQMQVLKKLRNIIQYLDDQKLGGSSINCHQGHLLIQPTWTIFVQVQPFLYRIQTEVQLRDGFDCACQ